MITTICKINKAEKGVKINTPLVEIILSLRSRGYAVVPAKREFVDVVTKLPRNIYAIRVEDVIFVKQTLKNEL